MVRDDGLRDCWECGSELPVSEFRTDFNFPDDLYPICEFCVYEIELGVRKQQIKCPPPNSEKM